MREHVVIVGAGHAGGTAAALLRQYGHDGCITLLGEETVPPYQRPPLSKAWLKGETDFGALALKAGGFYSSHAIDFRPGIRALQLQREQKRITLSDGSALDYDALILATGARAATLSVQGSALDGVLSLRSMADAERLKSALAAGKTLAIVGGGYIGLEAAATARSLGVNVIVLEREERLLARVSCTVLSQFFREYHERHGVRFEFGCRVTGIEGQEGHVCGVRLADGRLIACDAVLAGVGATPNDELAASAGLQTARGVTVDLDARTSDPAIYAIGDVAWRPMPIYDRMFRMESVPNALEQAKQAVSAIMGRPRPSAECPWQWSDQYDLKLQIAGYAFDVDEIVLRGDPASGRFAVFHLHGHQLQSVEAINCPAEFLVGKSLILSRKPVDKARLADASISIKEVAA